MSRRIVLSTFFVLLSVSALGFNKIADTYLGTAEISQFDSTANIYISGAAAEGIAITLMKTVNPTSSKTPLNPTGAIKFYRGKSVSCEAIPSPDDATKFKYYCAFHLNNGGQIDNELEPELRGGGSVHN